MLVNFIELIYTFENDKIENSLFKSFIFKYKKIFII